MIAVSIALAFVGCAFVVAVWDALRRGLAAQVRTAELRVEAMRREDVAALAAELREAVGKVNALERDLAIGRRGR